MEMRRLSLLLLLRILASIDPPTPLHHHTPPERESLQIPFLQPIQFHFQSADFGEEEERDFRNSSSSSSIPSVVKFPLLLLRCSETAKEEKEGLLFLLLLRRIEKRGNLCFSHRLPPEKWTRERFANFHRS